MPHSGARRRWAACRGRGFRPTSPPSWRTTMPAWETPTSSRAAWRPRSTSIRRRSRWDPPFTTCGISWDACCSRRDAPWTHESTSRSSYGRVPTTWTPPRCWASPVILRGTASRPGPCGKTAASAGPKTPGWKPTSPCWPARRRRARRTEDAAVSRWAAVGIAVALACQPSAADHEELGDRWYGGGAYRDALAEYQLGLKAHPGDADLEAKLGAAALHVGDYATAVNAYIALGEGDRSRAGEAADGLERSARAALG